MCVCAYVGVCVCVLVGGWVCMCVLVCVWVCVRVCGMCACRWVGGVGVCEYMWSMYKRSKGCLYLYMYIYVFLGEEVWRWLH